MTLTRSSIEWAINFVSDHSDGDLFPKIIEISAIKNKSEEFISVVENKNLTDFPPKPCRRFIVPKDEVSYRQATQLHPQDTLILSALIHQYGQGIESRRLGNDKVYSYRFAPSVDGGLYGDKNSWNDFWQRANFLSRSASVILYLDIADFYNQIYHHTVENQLFESGLPNQAVKWIIALLESTTAGVSRGIPIGPHPIHLIAEATLIPIDNSLETSGFNFIRYADDILIFCNSEREARSTLATVATVLDRQQRLMLQRHKTKIYSPSDFRMLSSEMIEDRPIDRDEARLLEIIRKYTGGNPYQSISYNSISREDWSQFSQETVGKIIREYLKKDEVDYIRLRWFYRKLAQVGHPGAIDVSLENLECLGPCFSNICFYLSSIQNVEPEQWKDIGGKLLALLEADEVKNNEFFRLSILSLFSRNEFINHFSQLAKFFKISDSFAKREIMLSAYQNKAFDWLRECKESFSNMDSWQKMAFIYCMSALPKDEKKYFINRYVYHGPFEDILARWAKGT
jgi:retron-type reverse transcriptase